MIHAAKLTKDPSFSEREARLAFVWSNMTVVDEALSVGIADSHHSLTFIEFLECLTRIAYMKESLILPEDTSPAGDVVVPPLVVRLVRLLFIIFAFTGTECGEGADSTGAPKARRHRAATAVERPSR